MQADAGNYPSHPDYPYAQALGFDTPVRLEVENADESYTTIWEGSLGAYLDSNIEASEGEFLSKEEAYQLRESITEGTTHHEGGGAAPWFRLSAIETPFAKP